MKITLIGGDARMQTVAALLDKSGAAVTTLGLAPDAPHPAVGLFSAVQGAEAVVLPLPASRDGVYPTANAPVPTLREIFSRADDEALILGGALPPAVREAAAPHGLRLRDYYESERLLLENAALTAEAAVAMAALDMPRALLGAHTVILGGGRIAFALLPRLLALGARVTLLARRAEVRARAAAAGAEVADLPPDGPIFPQNTAAVFSTVPARICGPASLATLSRGSYFYDLGGGALDPREAEACGILTPPAAGLPGKYSPVSAGELLYREICRILHEERGWVL